MFLFLFSIHYISKASKCFIIELRVKLTEQSTKDHGHFYHDMFTLMALPSVFCIAVKENYTWHTNSVK